MAASQQLSGQLSSLVNNMTQLYEASLFLEDWEEFSALAPTRPQQALEPVTPFERIEVDHVSFRYPPSASSDGSPAQPSRLALDDVSLEIRAGEVIALVGENGSGKTTLAKVLSGLYRPDSGQVRWDGVDASARDPSWIFERVAVLFQDFARFMLTARENIGLGRVERLADLDQIIRAAERARMASSTAGPTATTPSSAPTSWAARTCRSDSGSGSRSRAPSFAMRRS